MRERRKATPPIKFLEDLRVLRDALMEKGWDAGTLRYEEVQGAGHNEQAWAGRLGSVLTWLFGR